MDRRSVLLAAGGSVGVLTGCLGNGQTSADDPIEAIVTNDTEFGLDVVLTVESGETVLSRETARPGPGDAEVVGTGITEVGEYEVTVTFGETSRSTSYDIERFDVDAGSNLLVRIDGSDDVLFGIEE